MNPTTLRGPGREFSPGEAVKRLNPHLYGVKAPSDSQTAAVAPSRRQDSPIKRVRQSGKPLMNKLELNFYARLLARHVSDGARIRCQGLTFRLCNGVTLRPDFVVFLAGQKPACEEVKGQYAWEDSLIKLKMAAKEWPEFDWVLNWRDNNQWKTQRILP